MKLIDYMNENGLTVTKMAEKLACHRTYLSGILNGRIKPSVRLAHYIQTMTEGKVSAKSLLEIEDKENKEGNKE